MKIGDIFIVIYKFITYNNITYYIQNINNFYTT